MSLYHIFSTMRSIFQKRNSVIVIDIGGTNFRSSVFWPHSRLTVRPKRTPTPNFLNHPGVSIAVLQNLLIQKIVDTVTHYKKRYRSIKAVGISFPAPITDDGIVHQACTLWGDRGRLFPIRKILSEKLRGMNITMVNDITAAAERYASFKKYKHLDFFEIITVSSGIGSKIYDIRNGSVLLDRRSIGGEMGHVRIDFSKYAPICDCGGRGHIGAISSGRGVERLVINAAKKDPEKYKKSYLHKLVQNIGNLTNKEIVIAIKKNDPFVQNILDHATFPLACAIAHVSGNLGVDKFIFIGGFALNVGLPYLESLRRNLVKVDFYNRTKKEIPRLVELGINDDNDCLIGVGLLAQKSIHAKTL